MREYAREMLRRVRPDLRIKAGSPLESFLLDPLAALLPDLDTKLSTRYTPSLDDRGRLFLVERDTGELCEVIIRLYFTSPVELAYGVGQMSFTGGSGTTYTNKYAVSIPVAEMQLYVDDTYYYADVTVTGSGTFTLGDTLDWDDPITEYSFMSPQSVIVGGHLAESDTDFEARLERAVALRTPITGPGIDAWLSDQYGATISESYTAGFGNVYQQRDEINGTHLGGHVDTYIKGDLPVTRTHTFTALPLLDKVITETITVVFDDATTASLFFTGLTSTTVSAYSPASPTKVLTEGAVADFTVDRTLGIVDNNTGATDILPSTAWLPAGAALWRVSSPRVLQAVDGFLNPVAFDDTTAGAEDFCANMFGKLTQVTAGGTTEYYLAVSTDGANGKVTFDRDIHAISPPGTNNYEFKRLEPIQFTFNYNPVGVLLSSLERPVMWINSLTLLDPLTGEPYDPTVTVPRLGGFGLGVYGGGPYGIGSSTGWWLRVDDENYRYSDEEEGVLEIIGAAYYGTLISLSYQTAANVPVVQDAVDANKSEAVDHLVKAFVPVGVTISCDVTATDPITTLGDYIWTLSNRVELSDVVNELYDLGATFVELDDILTGSIFEKWNIDGTFTFLTPTSSGVLDIGDATSRFLPISITIRNTP